MEKHGEMFSRRFVTVISLEKEGCFSDDKVKNRLTRPTVAIAKTECWDCLLHCITLSFLLEYNLIYLAKCLL